MNNSQPCTVCLRSTIAISTRKHCSTSCNCITPISRSGLRMRPRRYQGARRPWDASVNSNNKKPRRCRQMTYPEAKLARMSDKFDSALLNQTLLNDGLGRLGRAPVELHVGLGTVPDGLKDHTIPLGKFEQLNELVLRGVGLNVKPQTNLLEADRHVLCDAERAAKV